MYKVFVDNKPIFLTESLDQNFLEKEVLYYHFMVGEDLGMLVEEFSKLDEFGGLCVYHESLDLLWQEFCSLYRFIEAAGGIVKNSEGEQLFILRHGLWDLPKGKIESGETPEEGAIREVEEECGISGLSIERELPSSYHTYKSRKGDPMLKRTYWFAMNSSFEGELTPQLEEEITEATWFKEEDQDPIRNKTFGSITDVMDSYLA